MTKDGLLKSIAETGYNVGFGAKKHFATYDIVEKAPGWIGFVSLAVGILSLVFEQLSAKLPSACLAIAGVVALYITFYDRDKGQYERVGKEMTQLFNQLRDLYRQVQGGADLNVSATTLSAIETAFYGAAISKQILFSDWFAHYKFFAQHQIEWIDEQKHFTWRDKVPVSLRIFMVIAALMTLGVAVFSGVTAWKHFSG